MRVEELAEELADFWFSAVAEVDWERRLQLLNEIHAQLLADMESRAEFEAVSPRFVAALIERLGAPAVDNDSQAKIYAASNSERHREAARAWAYRAPPATGPLLEGFVREDRRRFPRHEVDALSEIWVQGRPAPCRLMDLSEGGARLVVREPAPRPGTPLRLAVPDAGVRDAMVVFQNTFGIGVKFVDQSAAA